MYKKAALSEKLVLVVSVVFIIGFGGFVVGMKTVCSATCDGRPYIFAGTRNLACACEVAPAEYAIPRNEAGDTE